MPGIPSNIILRNLTNPPVKGRVSPIIATDPARRDGSRAGSGVATIVFQDNFDNQPDWNGAQNGTIEQYRTAGDTLPDGWDAARSTGGWSPSTGYPSGKESMYITGDPDKTRGGTGKAFVAYRFGRESQAQWGDSILAKYLPGDGLNEVFCRFWIKYQPGWIPSGLSKTFRVQAHTSEDETTLWNSAFIRPAWYWQYQANSFGARNYHAFRNSPRLFTWDNPPLINFPRAETGSGGEFANSWSVNSFDLNGDGTVDNNPEIPDLVNGGFLTNDNSDIVTHDEVYGDVWHKMEYHLKMNSAPGEQDGIFRQWFDDQLTFENTKIPWLQSDSNPGIKWKVVKIGGNDSFSTYEDGTPINDADQITQWYAIDDLEIWDGLPEGKV